MSKIKLDAQTALTATCPPGKRKIDVWDTHIPGFVLEVRASGGKTFALRYHDASGRQRQHKIGGFHEITCAEARKMAQKLRSQVVMGDSPAAQKATKRSIGTYGDLAAQHLAHAETYQKSFCSNETNMRVHILPRWGKVRLDDIRKQDVAAWLAEKRASGSSPATVEKIRVVFGRSFELGRQWDIAGIGANPTRGIAGPKINNARQRYLTTAEAKRLLDAAGRSSNTQLQAIVGLLLLTGARRAELLQA